MRNFYRVLFSTSLILGFCSAGTPHQVAEPRPAAAGSAPANVGQGEEPKPEPPPPQAQQKSPDEPNLETSMKLIQDRMSSLERLDTTIYWVNNRTGRHGQIHGTQQFASFTADASACQIDYSETDPNSLAEVRSSFNLRNVSTVRIMPYAEWLTEQQHEKGFADTTAWSDPAEFAILVTVANASDPQELYFIDQNIANEVYGALTRAVHLCGGGN